MASFEASLRRFRDGSMQRISMNPISMEETQAAKAHNLQVDLGKGLEELMDEDGFSEENPEVEDPLSIDDAELSVASGDILKPRSTEIISSERFTEVEPEHQNASEVPLDEKTSEAESSTDDQGEEVPVGVLSDNICTSEDPEDPVGSEDVLVTVEVEKAINSPEEKHSATEDLNVGRTTGNNGLLFSTPEQ